jgi:DNA-binding response OmpR family regulator
MDKKSLIYIVDDISDTADLLAHFLDNNGYVTEILSSGEEILQLLENPGPDQPYPGLILLDLMMPGMDGMEVIRRIRAIPNLPYIPLIMITASSDIQNRIMGLQTGADDFLAKPITRAELLARVRSLQRLKEAYDEKDRLLLEIRQAYNQLSATQGELAESEKRKLQMETMITTAGGICHEMSQPLTSALLTLQLLRQLKGMQDSDDFQTVETSLLEARVILDKLRALTRYETKAYLGHELILDIDRSSDTVVIEPETFGKDDDD